MRAMLLDYKLSKIINCKKQKIKNVDENVVKMRPIFFIHSVKKKNLVRDQ